MTNGNIIRGILITVVGGFILALLVAECRDIREMHDTVIKLKQKEKL